jgi:hypothetical protein
LAWVSETDSILIKGKRGRFLKRQTGCLKGFDGVKLIRRKYISISEVISLSYISVLVQVSEKLPAITKTLAYSTTKLSTAVKCFMKYAPGIYPWR